MESDEPGNDTTPEPSSGLPGPPDGYSDPAPTPTIPFPPVGPFPGSGPEERPAQPYTSPGYQPAHPYEPPGDSATWATDWPTAPAASGRSGDAEVPGWTPQPPPARTEFPGWTPQPPPARTEVPGWTPQPPSWNPPPTGWIPSSAGGGAGSGGSGVGGGDRGRSGGHGGGPARRILLILAALVVLAGVATAGIFIGEGNQSAQPTSDTTIPNPSGTGANSNVAQGKLNVAAVADKVDPGIVDITSVVGTTDEEAGTGMILTSNGDVLTNNHVVAGATSTTARIDGKGTTYHVKVLGTDVTQDVALLQLVGASNLHTVMIGNSGALAVGDPVVAIGNALDLQGPPTVTAGIISALGRSIEASDAGSGATEHLTGLIQTDAPINPGNSGGALANASGQVIGMNTAASQGSSTQAATNIGFAIPINEAISVAQQIEQHKASSLVQVGEKGYIGVSVENVSAAENGGSVNPFFGNPGPTPGTQHGAYVVAVEPSSAAVGAGIQAGDVITAVNGTHVTTATGLGDLLRGDHPGTSVSVTWVTPSGGTHTTRLTLGSGPTP